MALSLAASVVSYYLFVMAPQLSLPLFIALCILIGATMNMANPIGVAIGQQLFRIKAV